MHFNGDVTLLPAKLRRQKGNVPIYGNELFGVDFVSLG